MQFLTHALFIMLMTFARFLFPWGYPQGRHTSCIIICDYCISFTITQNIQIDFIELYFCQLRPPTRCSDWLVVDVHNSTGLSYKQAPVFFRSKPIGYEPFFSFFFLCICAHTVIAKSNSSYQYSTACISNERAIAYLPGILIPLNKLLSKFTSITLKKVFEKRQLFKYHQHYDIT